MFNTKMTAFTAEPIEDTCKNPRDYYVDLLFDTLSEMTSELNEPTPTDTHRISIELVKSSEVYFKLLAIQTDEWPRDAMLAVCCDYHLCMAGTNFTIEYFMSSFENFVRNLIEYCMYINTDFSKQSINKMFFIG